MDAIEAHYQKLDYFGKWCIFKSIKYLEIQDKQTLRMFKDLLVRAAIALKRKEVVVSDTDTLLSWYMVLMDSKAWLVNSQITRISAL